jgi:hypothetical protein
VFEHFGGSYSLDECLRFVEFADGTTRTLEIQRLQSEVAKLAAEKAALIERLNAIKAVV